MKWSLEPKLVERRYTYFNPELGLILGSYFVVACFLFAIWVRGPQGLTITRSFSRYTSSITLFLESVYEWLCMTLNPYRTNRIICIAYYRDYHLYYYTNTSLRERKYIILKNNIIFLLYFIFVPTPLYLENDIFSGAHAISKIK